MMITVSDIVTCLNEIAPKHLAEKWDNCGLQCGNLSWNVKKIWVSLDPTPDVVKAACDDHADLLLTHHPLIFSPLKQIDTSTATGRIIERSLLNRLSVYTMHTNLDSASDGLNDMFSDLIGLKDRVPFIPVEGDHLYSEQREGLGRMGQLSSPMTLPDLASVLKKKLKSDTVRVSGNCYTKHKTAVICTGSGGSFLDMFMASGADVYITGDIRYHDARKIEEAGLGIIDVGHFASEIIVVKALAERLKQLLSDSGIDVEIKTSDLERDPFTYI